MGDSSTGRPSCSMASVMSRTMEASAGSTVASIFSSAGFAAGVSVEAEGDGAVGGIVFQTVRQDRQNARIEDAERGEDKGDFPALLFFEFGVELQERLDGLRAHLIEGRDQLVGDIFRVQPDTVHEERNSLGIAEVAEDVDHIFFEVDGVLFVLFEAPLQQAGNCGFPPIDDGMKQTVVEANPAFRSGLQEIVNRGGDVLLRI